MAVLSEATIEAALVKVRTARDTLLDAIGAAGDYTEGDIKVERAKLLATLADMEKRLEDQKSRIPYEEITTLDVDVSALGEIGTEYIEEP